jgi:hypothetical protein
MHNTKLKRAIGLVVLLAVALASTPAALAKSGDQTSDLLLNTCGQLQVPAGNKLIFRVYARGVQTYTWNGFAWVNAPVAALFADADYHAQVGIHYAGPVWESNSGSTVKAVRDDICTPDPNAIAWLRLKATANSGPGIFNSVTYILRVNTTGGLGPTSPGSYVGQYVEVPYTAEYYFYRGED